MSIALWRKPVRNRISGWSQPAGIDLENFGEIVRIALESGVSKVIPHVLQFDHRQSQRRDPR
ncbi:Protein of uncharacterised function (DUF1341) [Pantoea agglomerans]|uniref:Protein of uncharacterized function (DUF1341) n=1 Tax=Enterobacter agglomerans TaxID=549 RepID=A0A379AAG2_ENTAG|nr:Protein of uncharacterised function (DUF1341) [Pantoea agglomerans]